MGDTLKAAIRERLQRRLKRRRDKQDRELAARKHTRWPTRNDLPAGGGPNLGL
jgi:hypothetical protein